jgi:hypothetical protein
MDRATPLGALSRGLLAGGVGTAAMTAAQRIGSRLQSSGGGDEGPSWENAPAPAKVAKRILEGVFDRTVPAARIDVLTHVTHWLYGVAWGGVYGLVQETTLGRPTRTGLLFGAGVWGASYVALVPMGIYEPPWRYPAATVAFDATYHLVYGEAVAAAYAVFDPR